VTERAKVNRPINAHEVGVIRAALERASTVTLPKHVFETIERLHVIDRCACGCDSVTFVPHDPNHLSRPVADALGTTPAGGQVGVLVGSR
jgi:hypothetical protein